MIAEYRFRSHDKHLDRNENVQYGLEIIKIGVLIIGIRSYSVMNRGSVFPSMILTPHLEKDMMPYALKKRKIHQSVIVWGCNRSQRKIAS